MRFMRLTVAVVSVALLAACQTDLTALNKDPNNPVTAPSTSLFTNAVQSTMTTYQNSFNTLSMTELFAQHVAQGQYIDEDRGHIRPGSIDLLWTNLYAGPLPDLQKVIAQGDAAKQPSTSGPARVMQSFIFEYMTDLWGDIPYAGALNGESGGDAFRPKYDTQKDIYYGLLKTLTDASAAMKAGTSVNDPGLGSADPIYGASLFSNKDAQWVKFANSLRARLAMQMIKADPAKAATELTAAFAGGMMASNADNAMLSWPGDGTYNNPWATNFSTRDDHRMSKVFIDTLVALADPRLKIFAQPTKADPAKYAGELNASEVATSVNLNTTSRPGVIFYPGATLYGTVGTSAGKATPSYLMTFAEVSFIQAEAAERSVGGLTPGQAAGFYNAGITASITQWGGTAAEAATYLAKPGVAYTPGSVGLQQIGLQKWIALFTQGDRAWAEWRRTGNPASIKPGPAMYADVPGVPRRLPYPAGEQSTNKTSLNEAVARQGADTYLTKMWWDK
ncbi:MAG: hypothetical protein JWM95_1624 [Gemmatimonadetes bacterium]|nr:hypothetical protein [Gemmatimonadota bacterium]